jgi:hypothetical protein
MMNMNSIILPLGGIAAIDKIEKDLGLISGIFRNTGGKSKNFEGITKLLLANRIEHMVSMYQLLPTSPPEKLELLGISEELGERTFYRDLQKIGRLYPVYIDRYQSIIKAYGLVDDDQAVDTSSSYFEGRKADLADYGCSRDRRPDELQITRGIATGPNGIPTTLTIQRGNIQDKIHINEILKVCIKILEKNSLLMFDAGGNSPKVKDKIRDNEMHYLTLKPKKLSTYRRHVKDFDKNCIRFEIGGREYLSAKKPSDKRNDEFLYIYFSKDLCEDQLRKKEKKFKGRMEKGNELIKKAKKHKQRSYFPQKKDG